MSEKILNDEIIKKTILENIKDKDTVFVFPTQIAASMWADTIISFDEVTAVALERFIAWDEFKGNSIRSRQQDKTSVPSVLRKIFAENIVKLNSTEKFFKSIITPEYAENASRFSSWISDMLPMLALWKKYVDRQGVKPDAEDQDLSELYNRYKAFLDENGFFDPAWETPPFDSNGKKYFIFFPEILMDYLEYKEILESASEITLVHIPKEFYSHKPDGYFYKNTRIELKEAVNFLRNKNEVEHISWDRMAVSVPDLESYGPYLERDLKLYQIPYTVKAGKILSKTGAGKIFTQMQNCFEEKFSFASMRDLLLNKELPWKNEELNGSLIAFGMANNCICSFEYDGKDVDVWEESFKKPAKGEGAELEASYYRELKRHINLIVGSKTFSEIRINYFKFREKFFDFSIDNFSVQNNQILSRCISELGSLIDLEEKYSDTKIFDLSNPYSFFCRYLDDKAYVPQSSQNGVQILQYKNAACAPFDVHVVVDASQNSVSVVYKELSFLREDKRLALNLANDTDITRDFIVLYSMLSQNETLYTCSAQTITGYGFANSYLNEINCVKDEKTNKEIVKYSKDDLYLNERRFLVNKTVKEFPKRLYSDEYNGFIKWVSLGSDKTMIKGNRTELVENKVSENLKKDGLVKISPTALKKFFGCPRLFMMDKVLGVNSPGNEAELIGMYTMGDLNHKILELYCKSLKKNKLVLAYIEDTDSIPEEHSKILMQSVEEALNTPEYSYLVKQILKTEKSKIVKTIGNMVKELSKKFSGYSPVENEAWYSYKDEKKGFVINGCVDCILKSPSNKYLIIDFKNSDKAIPSNVYYDENENIYPDVQLAIYKYIVENGTAEKRHGEDETKKTIVDKVSACMFYSIKDSKPGVVYSEMEEFTRDKKTDQGELNILFEKTTDRCFEMIDIFLDTVLKKEFNPETAEVSFSDCVSCVYKTVCRRVYTINNKVD